MHISKTFFKDYPVIVVSSGHENDNTPILSRGFLTGRENSLDTVILAGREEPVITAGIVLAYDPETWTKFSRMWEIYGPKKAYDLISNTVLVMQE